MPQARLSKLPPVDGHRRLGRVRGDLVGDGQDTIETVLTSEVQIAADLIVLQRRHTGLDLDETSPAFLAALANDRAVGND